MLLKTQHVLLKKQHVPLKKQHVPLLKQLAKLFVPLLMQPAMPLVQLLTQLPSKLSLFRIEKREEGEHGHFHMFLPLDMFEDVEPYYQPPAKLPNGKNTQGVVHFGALSFGLDGMPISWFTTNYWVTYEYMMPAGAIASQLRNFDMTGAPGDPLVNDWLTAAVQHFHDPIVEILHQRDRVLKDRKQELGSAVFTDKKVEILSRQPFDL